MTPKHMYTLRRVLICKTSYWTSSSARLEVQNILLDELIGRRCWMSMLLRVGAPCRPHSMLQSVYLLPDP